MAQMKSPPEMCPRCNELVEMEATLLDCRTGQMGPGCPECNTCWSPSQLKARQKEAHQMNWDEEFGSPEAAL